MAHQAIYRKWRPMTFDDIVGQSHITKTIKNQILSDSVGHAYLFCGTRGTGKTTCAKVLSRAVNCLNPKNGNPCNECEICRGIIDGSIMDVTEMDAASNNSVDDIRDIKGDINYIASSARYTVYIIDEVHMLSQSAFNALLKTLEEPPENVIFILATTEPHKVPQTILSRCQRFDFRRIRPDDIVVRMKEIAHADGYSITDGAYRMLASLADGSLRDGLSIMERVIAAGGGSISEEDIQNTLGIATSESVFELTDEIINGSGAGVINVIGRTIAEGKDLTQLAAAMLQHFRSLMVCKLTDAPEGLLDCDARTLVRLKSQSEKIPFSKIDHATTLISAAINDAKTAKSQRIIYELAFIKLARPETDTAPQAVMDRLSAVEQKLKGTAAAAPSAAMPSDTAELAKRISAVEAALKNGVITQPEKKPDKPEKKKELSHRLFVPIPTEELFYDYPTAKLARNWSNTVNVMSKQDVAYVTPLKNCVVAFDAEGLIILVPEDRYGFTQRTSAAHIDEIRELFKKTTGTDYTIKIARRADFDDKNILNPFSLPHRSAAESEERSNAEPERRIAPDALEEFSRKFEDIIINADVLSGEKPYSGEQTSIEELEEEREEFLEESEITSDEDEI